MSSTPTRTLGGVSIPDTPLITKVLKYIRTHSSDFTYNHVLRSFLLGFIIADKTPSLQHRNREVHAVAALMHDLGWDPTGELVSTDKRFEVDGAEAARNFLRKEASDWDEAKLQLVWDAIALHTTGSIVFYKEPEVRACALGIWADLQGPDGVEGGLLTWGEYEGVVKEFPRLDVMKSLKGEFLKLCLTKPSTTYDNDVGVFGEKFLDKKEYDRHGKTPAELLMRHNVEGIDLLKDAK